MFWKICLITVCVLVAHFCLIYHSRMSRRDGLEPNKINLIIDTDAGADDALAILLALSIPHRVNVLAITCTYGNTWLANVQSNVLKILAVARQHNIPVYAGADKPLIGNFTATDYFGKDGMGDFPFEPAALSARLDEARHAALAMADLAKRYPGAVDVVSLGPATNVALAASIDPRFSRNVKRFYVMGSSPRRAGFNFALDPQSAAVLLSSVARAPRLLTSSSAVSPRRMLSKDWRVNVLGKLDSERVRFMNKAESLVLGRLDHWSAADSIAMATVLWPELVTRSVVGRLTSEACASIAGSVRLDERAADHNVELVTGFNVTGFAEKLLEHLA